MRLWSHEDCSSSEVWGENIQDDIQLCAGYESGLISTCNVSKHVYTFIIPSYLGYKSLFFGVNCTCSLLEKNEEN